MSMGKCQVAPSAADVAAELWTDGGPPDVFSAVAYVARGALQEAWWNKWDVHMPIRPEVLAQRMHLCMKDDDGGATAALCDSIGLRARLNDLDTTAGQRVKRIITRRNDLVSAGQFCTDSRCDLTSAQTAALATTADKLGSSGYNLLLPLMYPEGSPNHPSWPAGHAVVAGACG